MKKRESAEGLKPPNSYVSQNIKLDVSKLENDFYRADLIFHGLDHSGASYEGRVFINNPNASSVTPDNTEEGYVGSFFVFGHGGCLGSESHCDVNRPITRFNLIPNPLVKERVSLIITDRLKELSKGATEFTVTIVPRLAKGARRVCQKDADLENVISISKITIEIYDKEE
jgi:hypothetical protein